MIFFSFFENFQLKYLLNLGKMSDTLTAVVLESY